MADEFSGEEFRDATFANQEVLKAAKGKGFNPALTVLVVVIGVVLLFVVGNYVLYFYAQRVVPPRKKKPVSQKKLKRERLKQGIPPAGD
ncbi:hypothetical protein O6H91_06G022900 [Diphasiastrum complanatum]|uniref:Uncharacterized protein n=1 Tax=Diphasiastrum complanatum TaxID=34168 RepID=A0ACC2DBK8_DIPCM|nr:hypothetical protein O6H91_06G022900 [Diphasiastrum complanatum]